MQGKREIYFRISSALKDIIGKDLITDDYVAVFELVKNAYDAHATKVDIFFENIYTDESIIKIIDNGKGMDLNDIENKWLYVAYSAKKNRTEDENYDYRDKINLNRRYAGAKGIGRFSCDRLGELLYLETVKNKIDANCETLLIDWGNFEVDPLKQFVDISIIHESKSDRKIKNGTCLEISSLRSKWDRWKILKLKDSLAKLIQPNLTKDSEDFKIIIHAPEELINDSRENEEHNKVNGEVKNFIFESLNLKTTRIKCSLASDGQNMITELIDGGTMIYRIIETSPLKSLNSIDVTLYYLNQSAKLTFSKRMGVSSVNYGHVFVYKNGFRVYPYGEFGEDTFGVDARKAQGYNRFIGTRDLIGQIEVNSSNVNLIETTSRGDGFIKNEVFTELNELYWIVLKRLEKYVVEVQEWGLSIESSDGLIGVHERTTDLLAKLSGSDSIKSFEVPQDIFEILDASQENSALALSKNLSRIAFERKDSILIQEAKKINSKIVQIQNARIEAENQLKIEYEKAIEATKILKEQISENLFLKSINTSEFQEVISLLHHIGIYAGTIDNNLKGISLRIQNKISLTNNELFDIIRKISFEVKKILNIVSFATKANFKLSSEVITTSLNNYIREYIQNIIPTTTEKELKIFVNDTTKQNFLKEFKPIEFNIIIDNLISNAKKAKAKEMNITIDEIDSELIVCFIDDGIGIPNENVRRIFDFGFTTTDGSGLGLFHIKKIVESMGGKIELKKNKEKGVTFIIKIKNK